MRLFFVLLAVKLSFYSSSQDTLNAYSAKIAGEEIQYFSPYYRFAKVALLTRCNGNSPISWSAPSYLGKKKTVTYELLIGHSTGTSSGDREFQLSLNGKDYLKIKTRPKQPMGYSFRAETEDMKVRFKFLCFDTNNDGFGKLYITLPAKLVNEKADFSIRGVDASSRDWLMVFMYEKGLKIDAESTQLLTRKENKRQLNFYIDQPFSEKKKIRVFSKQFDTTFYANPGYSKISLPVYCASFVGIDIIHCSLDGQQLLKKIEVEPMKSYEFHIIHHSHNDIGYSHLQTEVAEIQSNNIRNAINWVKNAKEGQFPIWHIESLWAVENFLEDATKEEITAFEELVQRGNIILSANYANILTGISRKEELNWMVEYAKMLEKKYGFTIQNAMITDIPGITKAALNAYVKNQIPYLSLGPNYVEAYEDHGDRVGGVVNQQGDNIFYWKPNAQSEEKLLVWTAGKGYSYFHNISDNVKQEAWEQRISDYCIELDKEQYPYELVQLRYTKKSDNGPVDTNLCHFIDQWNATYVAPKLVLSSVNTLFEDFEKKYGANLKEETGEISPYWEDGAYSTVKEEIENRMVSLKTALLEEKAKKDSRYKICKDEFYALHRNILLFSEHTWGAWCSISDPDIFFSTEQWRIKKSFLDSALAIYTRLEAVFGVVQANEVAAGKKRINDFTVDEKTGGLSHLLVEGKDVVPEKMSRQLFEGIYFKGITPQLEMKGEVKSVKLLKDDELEKIVAVNQKLGSIDLLTAIYCLDKKKNVLQVAVSVTKSAEKMKESMHLALPFDEVKDIKYGSSGDFVSIKEMQLPGSNHDFICTDSELILERPSGKIRITSPQINLFEIGGIINEEQVNGAKVWKRENGNLGDLYLYVFNNYWHTNYKAYQEGSFRFDLYISFD